MKWYDWPIIGALLVLALIPDPSDILDWGLPILEPVAAAIYFTLRVKAGGKKHK